MHLLLLLGAVYFLSVSCVDGVHCPTPSEIGCQRPPTPCPADRPFSVTSYFHFEGSRCTGCSYCVESMEKCPSLACAMFKLPPGCIPRLHTMQLDIGSRSCWGCDYLQCI